MHVLCCFVISRYVYLFVVICEAVIRLKDLQNISHGIFLLKQLLTALTKDNYLEHFEI